MGGALIGLSRETILGQCRLIRTSIQAVLREAVGHCRKPDLDRAFEHIGLWDWAQLDDDAILDMLSDIALMEPNQRAYDHFLDDAGALLPPADRSIAERMAGAVFSILRVAGRHDAAGVWLDDLLVPTRWLRLVDKGFEASAPEGLTVAMRVFDASPFHAGFSIVVESKAEFTRFCVATAPRGDRLPVRHSLAAALYGEDIVRSNLQSPDGGVEPD